MQKLVKMCQISIKQYLGCCLKFFKNMASMVNQKQRKQTSLLARDDPILSAKHFLPSSELPPYPDPKEMISLVAGR